jgi:hypothetical protein
MALVSYAKMEKTAITESNLADLKGIWIGMRTYGGNEQKNTNLIISNDSLPLACKFTFYNVRYGNRPGTTVPVDFLGKINDQGNLLFEGPEINVELSLYKDDGKMKLEGKYFWTGINGTMWFKKK